MSKSKKLRITLAELVIRKYGIVVEVPADFSEKEMSVLDKTLVDTVSSADYSGNEPHEQLDTEILEATSEDQPTFRIERTGNGESFSLVRIENAAAPVANANIIAPTSTLLQELLDKVNDYDRNLNANETVVSAADYEVLRYAVVESIQGILDGLANGSQGNQSNG
ncbi:hypothetical protein [Herbaspirillum sp. RV1423]|uniref:hypothetical protein n=1 Tax=Herbaspirillum sp. RV1423 TaxID=1443993 RepID=UPI0004B62F7F|nr:hypothetical protein [Herbaspirillum sp. RV1423]